MAARLHRCTALWGTCDWIEADPAIRVLPDALYRPHHDTAPWGLFAAGRRLGEEGRDGERGEPEPIGDAVAEGPFLYIGAIALHFGHFLVNTLPRLWPLQNWAGTKPRLLYHRPAREAPATELPFIAAILERLGLTSDDIVAFDRPMRVHAVTLGRPALVEQASVHAVFRDLCQAIGQGFLRPDEVDSVSRPLFLSKTRLRSGIGNLTNEAVLVEELERRGVEIAFPETLPFAEQVRLMNARRIVLGTAGSAFHTAALAAPGRRLVGLNWQAALNANFALLDRVNGACARCSHPHGTLYEERPGWGLSWTIADPAGVALALLKRAEWLERGEPDDDGLRPEIARRFLRPIRAIRGRRAR